MKRSDSSFPDVPWHWLRESLWGINPVLVLIRVLSLLVMILAVRVFFLFLHESLPSLDKYLSAPEYFVMAYLAYSIFSATKKATRYWSWEAVWSFGKVELSFSLTMLGYLGTVGVMIGGVTSVLEFVLGITEETAPWFAGLVHFSSVVVGSWLGWRIIRIWRILRNPEDKS
jgi:hypothetical protein